MGQVIPFKQKSLKEHHKGKTLCKHGHHKWRVVTNSKFDVKKGKLVTVFECERCQKRKHTLLD